LKQNGIEYLEDFAEDESIITGVEMAPVSEMIPKIAPQKPITKYVVQYNLKGLYIEKYPSARAASQASGAGLSSINKVLSGERNSAGRYVWRRFDADKIPRTITIDFDVSKINNGK
jgi:hypothetical protein